MRWFTSLIVVVTVVVHFSSAIDIWQTPFNASSAWNTRIGTLGEKVNLTTCSMGYNPWTNRASYSPGIFISNSADPVWTVLPDYPHFNITAHASAGFGPANGTDGEMIWVIGTTVWSFWRVTIVSPGFATARYAVKCDLNGLGHGVKYGDSAGIRASGFSLLGGLITRQALASGVINHAIVGAIPRSSLALPAVPPATSVDSNANSTYTGCHHMGARYAIPKTVPCPSNNTIALIVWKALQEYGLLIGDASGTGLAIYFERTLTLKSDTDAVNPIMSKIVSNLYYVASTATPSPSTTPPPTTPSTTAPPPTTTKALTTTPAPTTTKPPTTPPATTPSPTTTKPLTTPPPTTPSPTASGYVGCFYEFLLNNKSLRGLTPATSTTNWTLMTIPRCKDFCGLRGYSYAGLQNGTQCWCGQSVVQSSSPTGRIVGLNVVNIEALATAPASNELAVWNRIQSIGIQELRSDLNWRFVQPVNDTQWLWTRFDARVYKAAERGMRVLFTLWDAPPRHMRYNGSHSQPTPPGTVGFTAWLNFVSAAAKRYGPGGAFWKENPSLTPRPVKVWEIWNEPNGGYGFWFGKSFSVNNTAWKSDASPAPREFAELFIPSYAAIKAIDPTARVIHGGIVPYSSSSSITPGTWIVAMQSYLTSMNKTLPNDGMGFHPYASKINDTVAFISNLRSSMDSTPTFKGKGIDLTEWGIAAPAANYTDAITNDLGGAWAGSEAERASVYSAFLSDPRLDTYKVTSLHFFRAVSAEDLSGQKLPNGAYKWQGEAQNDPHRSREPWFGIIRHDGNESATTQAIQTWLTNRGPTVGAGLTKVSDSECSSPCGGSASTKCGGPVRLSVYHATVTGFKGCFHDNKSFTGSRDLPFKAYGSLSSNSVGNCVSACKFKNYSYAGVQWSQECYCGNSYGRWGADRFSACNMPCTGDSTEMCGSSLHNSVYEIRSVIVVRAERSASVSSHTVVAIVVVAVSAAVVLAALVIAVVVVSRRQRSKKASALRDELLERSTDSDM